MYVFFQSRKILFHTLNYIDIDTDILILIFIVSTGYIFAVFTCAGFSFICAMSALVLSHFALRSVCVTIVSLFIWF